MRVLVTGAAGYLGTAVVSALRETGHDAVAMVRAERPNIVHASEIRVADLLDPAALRRAVDGVDAVCHLAGLTRVRESMTDPLRYFGVNTVGTIALLDAMASAEVPRLVFASTGAIYGDVGGRPITEELPDDPPHPYASSKLAAEKAVEAHDGAAVVLRLLNVAGGRDPDPTRLIPRVFSAAARNEPLAINGDGTTVRDYVHVTDAANAFVAGLEHLPPPGVTERYVIGSGRGTSVRQVVAAVEKVSGRRVALIHRPAVPEPSSLVADPAKAMDQLCWMSKCSGIEAIVDQMWQAYSG
ncbi:NAD-dependent epimerase/dehydratase family protein [Nocardia pseudovaccinii]|uniref:NAD-dependent epimerase/dehydratase family protein n=1 Tax=Nocardia pseudovaccinii TaxID=189540 RepID=UPI0007A5538F|nr:NAD-dependent epimerase/dehydratase family protein [Nocardia pseudovaccinii]